MPEAVAIMTEIPSANREMEASRARSRVLVPAEGVILLVLGAAAIVLPGLAAIAVTVLLGWLFFFSGVVGLIVLLGARHVPGYGWSLVSALVALVAGAWLTVWPIHETASIMLVLGLFFAADGTFSVMYAIEHRRQTSRRWGWMLASGIFTLLLAAYVLSGMPMSLSVFGILVGIDLLFAGAALIAIGSNLPSRA
jgi:uncharacterized membrane protein HdeD (DUF308 family)